MTYNKWTKISYETKCHHVQNNLENKMYKTKLKNIPNKEVKPNKILA